MDPLEKVENKSVPFLIIIEMLLTASLILYMITYYIIQSNPLLPLQFDFVIYVLCLIFTMAIVSIPSLIIHKIS